jgi:hypothetical protein
MTHRDSSLKPTLAFVFQELTQRHVWDDLIQIAEHNGFQTRLTTDPTEFADIGFYSGDHNNPGNQTLTVITINGIDQDHVVRPRHHRFFQAEHWSDFDLGFLPGPHWMNGYLASPYIESISPKHGVFEGGWPKSDCLFRSGDPGVARLRDGHKRRVLYAPQTEADGKQSQVINALRDSEVQLLIKHWETATERQIYPWLLSDSYMENLYAENETAVAAGPWVHLIDPTMNFISCLESCDLLITDQSSVLYEALLCGIPTMTVRGWRHACEECLGPQPSPDICAVAENENIGRVVDQIFMNYKYWVELALSKRKEHFSHLGMAGRTVLSRVIETWNQVHRKEDFSFMKRSKMQTKRYLHLHPEAHNG